MIELRIYRTAPGRREDAVASLRQIARTLFTRHRFRPVSFWQTEDGDDHALVYTLEWASDAEREAGWKALYADPLWAERMAAAKQQGPAILEATSRILVPLDGMTADNECGN